MICRESRRVDSVGTGRHRLGFLLCLVLFQLVRVGKSRRRLDPRPMRILILGRRRDDGSFG